MWRCCLVVYICWPHAECKPSCRAINISFFSKCVVSRRSLPVLYLFVCHPLRGKSRYYAQRFDCVLNCPAVASFVGSISINTYFPRLSAAFKARKTIIRFVLGIFAHTHRLYNIYCHTGRRVRFTSSAVRCVVSGVHVGSSSYKEAF